MSGKEQVYSTCKHLQVCLFGKPDPIVLCEKSLSALKSYIDDVNAGTETRQKFCIELLDFPLARKGVKAKLIFEWSQM